MNLSAQLPFIGRVSFLDKLLFTKHLSVMIKAGITLSESLDILIAQSKSGVFKKTLAKVSEDVKNGQRLTVAFGKNPKVFDQFYISLISVGEESGTLEKSLEFLSEQLAKDYNLRKKIKAAMLYPALVFAATFIMGGFISLFILPKLVDFFEAFEVQLPLSTKILLFFANTMKNYGVLILFAFLVIWLIGYLAVQLKSIKPLWHRLILKAPLFGQLLAYSQLARFSRNFGVLLKSGVPITQSLQTTADTLSNLKFKNDLTVINEALTKGKSIGDALIENKFDEFPLLVVKMIAVGEKTGKLEEVLLYLADFYESEIDDISKNLSTILEPILLIVIGLVVGFVALAIISPIYELTGSIGR